MDDNELKQIIGDTANAVILQLKAEEFLQSGSRTAYEKTEELLWQYPALKKGADTLCQARMPGDRGLPG